MKFTVALDGRPLLEESLGLPPDDDARHAAGTSVSLLVVVAAVAPRPHDRGWLGLCPGPGQSLKVRSIIYRVTYQVCSWVELTVC